MYIEVDSHKLFVEDLGNKDGEAIVFLNGVMASTSSWYYFSDWFVEQGYRVILHDFKGQLGSDKPTGPYTFSEHANETVKILKKLGIKKAHFIGTSYGGEVGLKISILYPEMVQTNIIIDSVTELDEKLKKEIKNWITLAKEKDGYQFFWGMSKGIYGSKFMNENQAFLEKRAVAMKSIDKSYYDGQVILYETFLNDVTMTEELKKIKSKVLVICGADDHLKPIKFSKIIYDHIEGSEYVIIPDCGHVAIFEKPKELLTLMNGFIHKHKNQSLV